MTAHDPIVFSRSEVAAYFDVRVPKVRQTDHAEWRGPCPVHHGDGPNFSVQASTGQNYCHSQCGQGWDVLGLEMELHRADFITAKRDVFRIVGRDAESERHRRIVAEYSYSDENGNLLYQVVRTEPKGFFQRYPDHAGGWTWRKHSRQVLYHLLEILEAPIIFLVEGEKDCETLRDHGFVATCEAGGANAPWLPSFTAALAGHEVILIPDNDAPGRARVIRIVAALQGHVARLIVLELEGSGIKDTSDWFRAGHSEVELIAMLDGEEVNR